MSKRDRPLVVLVVVAVAAFAVWLHLRQTPEEQPAKPGPAVGVAAEEEPARLAETGSLWQFAAEAPKAAARKRSASLSLTASDGTGLKLASLDARGIVQGPLAFTEIRLVFENPQSRTLEGTFRITLPQGAAISRFAMRQGDRWQEGEVVEKQAARRAYEDFLHRRQDPALLEQAAGNEFSARVFPIPPKGHKELIVSYSQELSTAMPYRVALRGLPEVTKLDATVKRSGGGPSPLDEIHSENTAPDRDLLVDASRLASGDGLRAGELVLARVKPAAKSGADAVASAVVMIDTSASRALGYQRQLQLVEQVLSKLDGGTRIVVAAFDQGVDSVYEGVASGYGRVGTTALRQRQAFGASDLQAALAWARRTAKRVKAKRVILVTDGVPTKGSTKPQALRATAKTLAAAGVERIDAIAIGGIRDDALLRGLVTSGLARNGVVIDGARGPDAAKRRLSSATRSVDVKVQGASWQWPLRLDGVQPGDEVLVYAVVPKGTAARIRLGKGPATTAKLTEIDRALLERAWAKAKIAQLTERPTTKSNEKQVKREIVRLSKTYRVLSRHTALLVLETEADYERYDINRKALADILTIEGSKLVRRHRSEDMLYLAKAKRNPTKGAQTDGVVLQAPPAPTARPGADDSGQVTARGTAAAAAPASSAAKPVAARPAPATASASPGLGSVGTIGHGAGTGRGQGFGSGHGRLGRSHRSRPPSVRMGATSVRGRLPPEVVQRIVRQNFGRFRLCYENGLRKNPNIKGRVTVRFAIGRDGRVSTVASGASALPRAVAACVRRVFTGLAFPKPEGGIVTVTYPITFAPDGGPVARRRAKLSAYQGKMAVVMDALAKGDNKGALHEAIAFRSDKPGDVMALVALGEAFEALGEVRSAARSYGSIIDLFSSRADLRRMAGQRLERLNTPYALGLAADSFDKAASQRPDHPASHRLLAYARLRSGDAAGAFAAIEAGAKRSYPRGRFRAANRILTEDMALIGAAWMKAEPARREEIERRLKAANAKPETRPSVRFVLMWETDTNDVDFHIRDAKGGHAYFSRKKLPSGGKLYADVTTGYGPECFTIPLAKNERSGPYTLQAHYYSRGPMGYGMGKLEIIEHDGKGGLTFEERPFVVMRDRAFVDLGSYPAKAPAATPTAVPSALPATPSATPSATPPAVPTAVPSTTAAPAGSG